MFRMLSELIGPHWRPLEVCFTHRAPKDVSAHRAFFGRSPKFNQEFNGLVCLAIDLSKPRESGDQVAAGFARKHLEAALRDQRESVQETCRQLIWHCCLVAPAARGRLHGTSASIAARCIVDSMRRVSPSAACSIKFALASTPISASMLPPCASAETVVLSNGIASPAAVFEIAPN
jgi:hypothetical protein